MSAAKNTDAMRKLCRNCESFVVADGKTVCKCLDIERTDTDNPPPESMCWKKRPKLSGDALSLLRSQSGRKGGRPAGYGKGRSPTKQASLRAMDHAVLSAYARLKGTSMADSVHRLCGSILIKYPQLKPENWVD